MVSAQREESSPFKHTLSAHSTLALPQHIVVSYVADMPHPIESMYREVDILKAPGYLLTDYDKVIAGAVISNLAVAEVSEVEEALHANNLPEAAKEVSDVGTFIVSRMRVHHPGVGPLDNLANVNGYGRHDAAWERLQPVILDCDDDPRAVHEVLGRLWSIARWNPYAMHGLLEIAANTRKVHLNYPVELMTSYDPTLRRESLPDEVVPRYEHMVAGLRRIRKVVQRTLQPEDWKPHRLLLENWQQSASALQQLDHALQTNSILKR